MKILRKWRPDAGVFVFVLILAAGNLALYQKPLLGYGISVSALPDITGWLQILSLQVVQFCLLAGVLFFVAIFSIAALRVLGSLLALINAAALYFMLTYNMEFDRSMIANIVDCDCSDPCTYRKSKVDLSEDG